MNNNNISTINNLNLNNSIPSNNNNNNNNNNLGSIDAIIAQLFKPSDNIIDLSKSWNGKNANKLNSNSAIPNLSSSITHNNKDKTHKADLFTPYGWDATKQAFTTGAFLMTFLSQDKNAIQHGKQSHQNVHQGMVRASKEYVSQLDPNDKENQKHLRGIASQWVKGYSPNTGGMGRFPKKGVNLRKKLTQELVNDLTNKGIKGLKVGKSLKDCGVTDLAIVNAYDGRENIPQQLETSFNPTFDNCPGWGTKPFAEVPTLKLEDMSMKEVGLEEGQIAMLFAPAKVPAEYRTGNSASGAIDLDHKLDENLLARIIDRGIMSEDQLEKTRLIAESNLQRGPKKHNAKLKAALLQMLDYLDDNATSHYDSNRNSTALKTASTQVYATLGQFFHDHILEGNDGLKEEFFKQGLCDEETIKLVKDFDNSGRQNPLLAEVKNSDIKKALHEAVLEDEKKITEQFYNRLSKINDNEGLDFSENELKEFSKKLFNDFASKIENMETNLDLSNARGRVKYQWNKPYRKDIAITMRGDEGKNKSVMNLPQGSDDELAEKLVIDNVPGVFEHFSRDETGEGLHSGPPPKTELRQSGGLDSSLRNLYNNPFDLISFDTLDETEEQQKLLHNFIEEEYDNDSYQEIQNTIGEIQVPYNKAVKGQTISFKEFAQQESVSHLMNKYGVRTICGVSGTTLDCVVGTLSCMSREDVNKLLTPLLEHAKNLPDISKLDLSETEKKMQEAHKNNRIVKHIPYTREDIVKEYMRNNSNQGLETYEGGEETMHFLSCIATLMQGGRYHTVGEVIGGMFVAARGLEYLGTDDSINIGVTRNEFERLIADFSVNPEHYIPITNSSTSEDDDVDLISDYDDDYEEVDMNSKDEIIKLLKVDLPNIAVKCLQKAEKERKINEKRNFLKA